MITTTEIKKQAREILNKKWWIAILIILLNALIMFCLVYISILIIALAAKTESESDVKTIAIVLGVAITFIMIPINYGISMVFLKIRRKEEVKIFEFLSIAIKNYERSWKLKLWVTLKKFVPIILTGVSIILLFIGKIIYMDELYKGFETTESGLVLFIAGIFFISAIILSVLIYYNYALANYIAYDEPGITAQKATIKSKQLMRKSCKKLFILQISFIGWVILSMFPIFIGLIPEGRIMAIFLMGLAMLFVNIYYQVSKATFYDELRKNK